MSIGHYGFCWLLVMSAGFCTYTQQWGFLVINTGLMVLTISDAIIGALKERRK